MMQKNTCQKRAKGRRFFEFNKKYNYLDDGNASERVIKEIFKEMF